MSPLPLTVTDGCAAGGRVDAEAAGASEADDDDAAGEGLPDVQEDRPHAVRNTVATPSDAAPREDLDGIIT